MRRTGKANVLTALIGRETNCRGTHDHDLLTSYAEDACVMSCNQTKECELPGSPRSTFLVCFSPDKTKMASSHGDHTVRIVDCKTFKCMNTLRGHPRTPWCIAFHPSSNELLASGCLGGEVRLWNLKTGDSEVYTPPDRAVVASLAFHPMDHVLLIATSNKLLFWSWDQPEPFACVQTASTEEKVRLVEFSPLGDHILTAVTNIPQPASNSGTIPSSRSSVVNRLLQSVGNSRMSGSPFTSYVLRPSTSNSSTSLSASASTSSPSTGLDAIPETTSSTSSNSSESMLYSNSEPVAREAETISSSVMNQNDSENQDYRGMFAVFRARDNNSWNFNVTSNDNDSAVLEHEATGNSVSFESDSRDDSPGVSMSVTAGETDVYSETPDEEPPTIQQSVPFDSQYFTSAPADQPVDRVVGVGRVINVGPSSSRSSYLSHGSNHSSSFATLGGSQGSGTAVATATARTFRHVHTAVVVADMTNGGPQFALRTAINRAIAGAFAGCGEGAVASNIINTTHRLQWWDFSQVELPDLKNSESHVIASSCKVHNDASCDISSDGKLLATFVPSAQGFPDDGVVAVYSLEKATLGQCLFAKEFGPNAISISLSPLNRYIMVGLAARRLHWHLTSKQVVAQIFRLTGKESTSDAVKPVVSITHDCDPDRRSHVSVNAAFFHPLVGNGLVYGTNRGHLHMRQFGRSSSSRLSSLSG